MDAQREAYLHRHRAIANYLALYCWISNSDALIVPRDFLEKLLSLERFKETRLKLIKEDFEPFFPFVCELFQKGTKKFSSFILARRTINDIGPEMSAEERVAYLKKQSINTLLVSQNQDDVSFEVISSTMLAVAAGVTGPANIPPIQLDTQVT